MDKETIALLIAKNGLDTAQSLLTIKAGELAKRAESATGKDKTKLLADARKSAKLAKALEAAEAGVNSYLGF